MNLNSKYFDRIRIRPDGETVEKAPKTSNCEWRGCSHAGGYRAPKGRGREGQYFNLCLDHVREYNKTYNYFAGMKDDDIIDYQRSASTGHRPTWTMGVNGASEEAAKFHPNAAWASAFSDPFGIFGGGNGGHRTASPEREREREREPVRRPLRNLERKSFAALDLEGDESGEDIKARYKTLVKQYHPDANGGDRSAEDRLRQVIQAYHYLKAAGFC
jgi:hypothetical protein